MGLGSQCANCWIVTRKKYRWAPIPVANLEARGGIEPPIKVLQTINLTGNAMPCNAMHSNLF